MEMKLIPYTLPQAPAFNYDELLAAVQAKADEYAMAVYTDDTVKLARADRAKLNRLRKALNDERIRLEREYMRPFAQFKAQVDEIIAIIDKPVKAIDQQIKSIEDERKAAKMVEISAYWNEVLQAEKVPAGIALTQVFEDKWLNATMPMTAVKKAMDAKLEKMAADLAVLRNLPSYTLDAEHTYLTTLNLAQAISEANEVQQIAERHAALAAKWAQAQQAASAQQGEWIAFEALLTPMQAQALAEYFKANGIVFRPINNGKDEE